MNSGVYVMKHFKALGQEGNIGHVYTNAHARYVRHLEREHIREHTQMFISYLFTMIDLKI